jgi:predicted Zn-dependent protease
MAHWVGHVAARHGLEQGSKFNLTNCCRFIIPLSFLIFSHCAEEEADQLGAQSMWASGHAQQALGDFFKKLQLKVEANPGSFPRLFSRHLMTGDRIAKVNRLVARFPDRPEFKPNSFEFSAIKARHAKKRPADSPNTRPVLKRR